MIIPIICCIFAPIIMKILFLTYHGFEEASGISKKMLAQIKGLRQNGHEVHVCYYDRDSKGYMCRFVDGQPIRNYGKGLWAAIIQRTDYRCLYNYCIQQSIELIYVRSYMNATPSLVSLFKKLRKAGVRSVMEVPTYPYDQEFKGYDWNQRLRLYIDKLYRHQLSAEMEAIVTFSEEETIFGQRTIRISNGVDLDSIPLHQPSAVSHQSSAIHLIAVAEVHPWHGFDRLIHGLGEYYKKYAGNPSRLVFFHLVGNVWPTEMKGSNIAPGFASYIKEYDISKYVIFHGKLFGEELDKVFDQCQFAIGSLARHRSGISVIKTLKNREYASRGIPFIYSEQDSDFDDKQYVLKAQPDESPIDVDRILSFLDNQQLQPKQIRQTVEHLSWKVQMQIVIDALAKKEYA